MIHTRASLSFHNREDETVETTVTQLGTLFKALFVDIPCLLFCELFLIQEFCVELFWIVSSNFRPSYVGT